MENALTKRFVYGTYAKWNILLFVVVLVLLSRLFLYLMFELYAGAFADTRSFLAALNVFDGAWYQGITTGGYTATIPPDHYGMANWAFFPLYSYVVRGFIFLTGMEINWAGFLVNLVFQAAALYLVFLYIVQTRGNVFQACFACFLLSLGAYTLYFASYYTESLFLLLFMGALFFLHKRKYLLVGLCGFFLTLTRSTGVVLLAAILVQAIADYCVPKNENRTVCGFFRTYLRDWKFMLGTCLVPLGIGAFMVFLYARTGDALAFVHIQSAWGGSIGNPLLTIWNGFASMDWQKIYQAVWAVAGLCLCAYLFVKKRYAECAAAVCLLLIPLSVRLQSLTRYMVGCGLFVFALTDWLAARNKKWLNIALAVLSVAIELMTLYYWFRMDLFAV